MTNVKAILSGLLIIQLLVIGGVYFAGNSEAEFEAEKPFVSVTPGEVDKIVITGEDGKQVTLTKSENTWYLPEYSSLQARGEKVGEVLKKISDLRAGWPVASSSSSQQRFEVSKDKFQRQIELYREGTVAETLYLGTSPGYRSVHARRAGDSDIFSVKLASHEFPAENKEWFDASFLALKEIKRISFADFTLEKNDEAWSLAQTAALADGSAEVDQDKAKSLSRVFTSLTVEELAEGIALDKPVSVKVAANEGEFIFDFAAVGDGYFMQRQGSEQVFKISESAYKKIEDIDLSAVIAAAPEVEPLEQVGEEAIEEESTEIEG